MARGKATQRTESDPEEILVKCEEQLKTQLTNWDEIYARIRMSSFGGDFPAHKFLRTPVSTISWVLEVIDEREKIDANINSITAAQLAQIVLQVSYAFSGSKKGAPKTTVKEFLPFPNFKPHTQAANKASSSTKFILEKLIASREIPLEVYLALNGER